MNEIEIYNEEWRDIPNYEGLYQISNMGRVKSLANDKSKKEKILRQGKNTDGYLLVVLCKNGIRKTCKVHRLVANAFIENPLNLPTVNHKNEIKTDNRVDNLEWMSLKENLNYGTAQARRVASTDWKAKVANTDYNEVSQKRTEKTSKQVYQYDKDGTLVAIYPSTAECGRSGFCQVAVSACCRGKLKSHRGFIWSYSPIN